MTRGGKAGALVLVLHAHLPFVRHPEHERFLEEDWLYEAITETYIPLLWAFERLSEEGTRFRIAMSLTPTLLSMFEDPLLRRRYVAHLTRLLELAEKEVRGTARDPRNEAARMYRDRFRRALDDYENKWKRDLAGAFRAVAETGCLEILSSCATHGFLPLLNPVLEAVRAQVAVGMETHRRVLGKTTGGFWIPECAYFPGHDRVLLEQGVSHIFLESHGLTHATPPPRAGVARPARTPKGLGLFARDATAAKQVWSGSEGYPGDGLYREFYRDLGYDAGYDYIRPYIHPMGFRIQTGIKYHRITDKRLPLSQKDVYRPAAAFARAEHHAGHFMWCRERQVEHLAKTVRRPVITASFDAELFGHWWFEGPVFLEHLLRKTVRYSRVLDLAVPREVLNDGGAIETTRPPYCTWGDHGDARTWLNGRTEWIYPHLIEAAERMVRLARRPPRAAEREGTFAQRMLNQMARELLLAQASDWPFLMTTGTAVAYATKRVRDHLRRFLALDEMLRSGAALSPAPADERFLRELERRDNIFPWVDFRVFR